MDQMSSVQTEIAALEERLREAERGPAPEVFEELLADNVVLVSQDGQAFAKTKVVEAHRPGKGAKFTRVEISEMNIIEHGPSVAVVTCKGFYEGPQFTGSLSFMRVWVKKNSRWQIAAGAVSNASAH
jgi:Domain of unknown function (DUF4440)